jgi:uncharacterized protein
VAKPRGAGGTIVPAHLPWRLRPYSHHRGPLFEEPGWRGFALPRLERLYGPLLGTLILGVLWACWHLPLFMSPSWAAGSGGGGAIFDIAAYVVTVIGLSVVFTWVFNNTQASILLAILVHASNNTSTGMLDAIFPADALSSTFPLMSGFGVVAVVLIVLTRGRLDYGRLAEARGAPRVR